MSMNAPVHERDPVFFRATTGWTHRTPSSIIPFSQIHEDSPGRSFASTGVYTAPKTGKYLLLFFGISTETETVVHLRINEQDMMAGSSYYLAGRQEDGGSLLFQSTVNLYEGDQVDVFLVQGEVKSGAQFIGVYLPWNVQNKPAPT